MRSCLFWFSRCLLVYFCISFSFLSWSETTFVPLIPADPSPFHAPSSLEDGAHQTPNSESVTRKEVEKTAGATKNFRDLLEAARQAQTDRYGAGEGGGTRVRLRGSPALEPSYSFFGMPLSGATSASSNLDLLPVDLVSSLEVYPDAPPFWLAQQGVGGNIDVVPCNVTSCFFFPAKEGAGRFAVGTRVGDYHYRQESVKAGYQYHPQASLFTAASYTRSQEDYPVFNNNNNSLHPDEGQYEPLQNNDFHTLAVGQQLSYGDLPFWGTLTGVWSYGQDKRGIPDAVGSDPTHTRLERRLALVILRAQNLSLKSGWEWNEQVGILYNDAHQDSDLDIFNLQGNDSQITTFQAKSWVVVPQSYGGQTGLSAEVLWTHFDANTKSIADPDEIATSSSEARLEERFAAYTSLPLVSSKALVASAEGWSSWAQDTSRQSCAEKYSATYCITQQDTQNSPWLGGYTLTLQGHWGPAYPFLREVHAARRPTLNELYGSPGGIEANESLQPEQSQKTELGLNLGGGEAGIFWARDKDLILLMQTSAVSAQYQNVQEVKRWGAYASLAHQWGHWAFWGRYQYLKTQIIESGTQLPRSPSHMASGRIGIVDIQLQPQLFWSNHAGMSYESPFYLDTANINRMEVPPIYNIGTMLDTRDPVSKKRFTLSFDIDNVTNEQFSTVTNPTGLVWQVNSMGYLNVLPSGRRYFISLGGEF